MNEAVKRQPKLGVCYYPEHWPESEWADHAKQMADIGLSYVRIGEFAWSRLEPKSGQYAFDWLEQAMDVLGAAGLKVVLGTPTATPPKWLCDALPDMFAMDKEGRRLGFGSRRHYDFSHDGYRDECSRIVTKLAERFANHSALAAWQTDNEYGCHSTVYSYSPAALRAFRLWLTDKYGSIDELNQLWGNVFWSMEYSSFDEIDLPGLMPTDANPSHELDFTRFSSDQVVRFNKAQVDILRRMNPEHDIIHNFMGKFVEFDHFDVGADLDISSWDAYPLGAMEQRLDLTDEHKRAYLNQGDPDFQAFHHDLYRATSDGRWWIMEQQPGPVNWAPWNPAPLPGMVRLWSWEAIAHGAEVVSYFRWRQAPFAQEQMHAGLTRPDGSPDIASVEAAQVASELAELDLRVETGAADIALVMDYHSIWMTNVQRQGKDYDPNAILWAFYSAARKLGLSLDIVPSGVDLSRYRAVIVPNLLHVSDAALEAFEATDAAILFGPRTGSKSSNLTIPGNLPPGPLASLLPITVERVESLRPGTKLMVEGGLINKWREHLKLHSEPDHMRRAEDSTPIAVRYGKRTYLAGWPDEDLLEALLGDLASAAGVDTHMLPEGVRLRKMGENWIFVNYGRTAQDMSAIIGKRTVLLGKGAIIPSAGVLITLAR